MNARILWAASEHHADMLYATRFYAPDPFFWAQIGRSTYAAFSDLEVDRARATAHVDHVLSMNDLAKTAGVKKNSEGAARSIAFFLRSKRVKRVTVDTAFPLGFARQLERYGIRLVPARDEFFPTRLIKSPQEIEHLRHAQVVAEAGMARAVELLRVSRPDKKGLLQFKGKPLTSEMVQGEINATIALLGGVAVGTIVAGGEHACDPHERGSGPLPAHRPIIIDIFPRIQTTGYFGDITRTFVRGTPSTEVLRLYNTVLKGQQTALKAIRAGCDGKKLQDAVREGFTAAGFPTEQRDGRQVGFFHGLGHGVGLEIHEAPRLSAGKLRTGMVITIEPGLYQPGLGGVRVEDLVAVRPKGCDNLTRFSKEFVL